VPYQRFHEVNTRVQSLEAERTQLQAQIAGHQQQVQQQVQAEVAKVRQEQTLRVALARAGVVADGASDYLASQYQALGPAAPPVDAWVQQRKAAEPYFFGQSAPPPAPTAQPPTAPAPAAAVGPAPTPPAAPPAPPPAPAPVARGNPDAGVNGAAAHPNTQDPPLTLELIDQMDAATYRRRKPEVRKFLDAQRRG